MGLGDTSEDTLDLLAGCWAAAGWAVPLNPDPQELINCLLAHPTTHPPTHRPATHCRMNWMASSYFIPLSMRASATSTGALGTDSRVIQASAPPPLP